MSANLGKFRVITTQRIIHGRFCADFQGEKTGQMGLNFARRRAKMARRNFGGQGHQGRQLREQDVRLMSKSSAALEEKGGGGTGDEQAHKHLVGPHRAGSCAKVERHKRDGPFDLSLTYRMPRGESN